MSGKRCPDCLDKGYLSLLGRRGVDRREIVPCTCKEGRAYQKLCMRVKEEEEE
jgi:Zn ribbon nucleic-acid-binding protein